MRRVWAGFLLAGVLAGVAFLVVFSSAAKGASVAEDAYAKIEKAEKNQLVLQLGSWQNGTFTPLKGRVVLAPGEGVVITTSGGAPAAYSQLHAGSVVHVVIAEDTESKAGTIQVQLVEEAGAK